MQSLKKTYLNMNKDTLILLDKRYKVTKKFISNKEGTPIYKKRAFFFIDKVLGPQYKWINKSPEEYFSNDVYLEALQAIKILNFTGKETLKEVRKKYINMSKQWHPDCGGHSSAFNILNYSYIIFLSAFNNKL